MADLTDREIADAAMHAGECRDLLLAIHDDLQENWEKTGWLGRRLELLVKVAVRHCDHVACALGSTEAGNFAKEFEALGSPRGASHG